MTHDDRRFFDPGRDDFISWDDFVTALEVWALLNDNPTVQQAARVFRVADDTIRNAVLYRERDIALTEEQPA